MPELSGSSGLTSTSKVATESLYSSLDDEANGAGMKEMAAMVMTESGAVCWT